ncbi:uncharacterized protein E0L32_004059 [Thyridium curvatum]|uniref:Uncharacterized protein n=1 Tax=Thyridium curvatum TaxID=1093900 RepID=A0A507BBN7_9PEZI|nr:uncharacterized protein E0L32_004059 [Thyridium curvatum]TPX16064.1 hypothetical protein E0L32_004059 [Thyridium curvatum]
MVVTTTPVFLWSILNLGPVTETFTAAPSCATKTDGVMIASKLASSNETVLVANYPGTCGKFIQVGDCMPLGSKRDEHFKSKDPLQYDTENYLRLWVYSPGLFCPSGWTTAGAVTRQADGSIASPTGFFAPEPSVNLSVALLTNGMIPPATVIATALEPGETAAACCPESWPVLRNGECYSPMPTDKFPATAGCATRPVEASGFYSTITTTIDVGSLTSASAELITPTYTGKGSLVTTTWTGTAAKHSAVTVMPAVVLVHKSEDAAKTTGGGSSGGAGGGGTGTNAAVAMRPGGPDPKALGGLALVVMTAVMAGAAVMMPW